MAELVEAIREGRHPLLGDWRETVAEVREADKEEARRIKRERLAYWTPNGRFGRRGVANLIECSQNLFADFDNLERPDEFRDRVAGLPECAAAYRSTSNGVHAALAVEGRKNADDHRDAWCAALLRLDDEGMAGSLDPNPKSVASAAFLSHDPDAVINPQARPLKWTRRTAAERGEPAATVRRQTGPRHRGEGRNVDVFDWLRGWALAEVRNYWPGVYATWQTVCVAKALERTRETHPTPLDERECYHIGKSVAGWTWRCRERGRKRGVKSGQARRWETAKRDGEIVRLRQHGWPQTELADKFGLSQSAVSRLLARSSMRQQSVVFDGIPIINSQAVPDDAPRFDPPSPNEMIPFDVPLGKLPAALGIVPPPGSWGRPEFRRLFPAANRA